MSSTYQVSLPDEDDSRLRAAMKKRKDMSIPKDALKAFALERISEILGDKK